MSLVTTSGAKILSDTASGGTSKASSLADLSHPSSFNPLTSLSDSLAKVDLSSSFTSKSSSSPSAPPSTSPRKGASDESQQSSSSSSSASAPPSSLSSSSSPPCLSFDAMLASLNSADEEEEPAWELALGSLSSEISSIERQRQEQAQIELQHRLQKQSAELAADQTGLTPLPHQDAFGQTFHAVIMEQYNRLGNLGLKPKEIFISRKLKAKQSRAAKRAEDAFEKQNTKLTRSKQKQKSRKKANY